MKVIDQLFKLLELFKLIKSYILSIFLISNILAVFSVLLNEELANEFIVDLPDSLMYFYNWFLRSSVQIVFELAHIPYSMFNVCVVSYFILSNLIIIIIYIISPFASYIFSSLCLKRMYKMYGYYKFGCFEILNFGFIKITRKLTDIEKIELFRKVVDSYDENKKEVYNNLNSEIFLSLVDDINTPKQIENIYNEYLLSIPLPEIVINNSEVTNNNTNLFSDSIYNTSTQFLSTVTSTGGSLIYNYWPWMLATLGVLTVTYILAGPSIVGAFEALSSASKNVNNKVDLVNSAVESLGETADKSKDMDMQLVTSNFVTTREITQLKSQVEAQNALISELGLKLDKTFKETSAHIITVDSRVDTLAEATANLTTNYNVLNQSTTFIGHSLKTLKELVQSLV